MHQALFLCKHILLRFKKGTASSQLCRRASIQNALESIDPGASNGASDLEIQQIGLELVSHSLSHQHLVFAASIFVD